MEFVYVVPRARLFPDCYPQGLHPFGGGPERARFEDRVREHGFFVERDHAERNPELKQIIPYNVMVCGDEILLLRRSKQGGESRLHDKLSIGVGGHINPEDLSSETSRDPIRDGAIREIEEEIEVRGTYDLRTVGFLNDDSNPVGAVHLGIVQVASIAGSVEIRETEVLGGELVSPAELRDRLSRGENFETWSAILIDRIDELLPTAATLTA
jgi:predicted NUDIX family phosphoesterase